MKRIALSFAAAMLAAGSALADIRAVTPTAWNGKPDCWQMKRHAEKMSVVTNGGAKVVFIGDSITHGWEKPARGAEQLKKYFSEGDWKMLNLGTGADRTEHVLWRITEGGELDGYEAKIVVVMIGTNNTGHHTFAEEPPVDTILGVRKIIDVVREKQPNAVVVLCSIFPRGADPSDGYRRRNDIVNAEIMRLCDGKTVFWLDFGDDFLEKDGTLPKSLCPDLLHPNGGGYEIWYREIKPFVEYALSDRSGPAPRERRARRKTAASPDKSLPASVNPVTRSFREGYGKKGWWLDRLLEKRNQIAASGGKIDVVLLGDSITHNWEKQGKSRLARLREKYSVLDIGYSGDRTQHLLWRIENGELDGYEAKAIVLMIGTNNTNGNPETGGMDKPEDIAAGVRKILDVIAEKQPNATVILHPIFPRGASDTYPRRVCAAKANEIIKGFADGKKVVWVDFNDKFLDENGDVKWIMPDRVHPNPDGYEIWLGELAPRLEAICGK